MEDKNKKIYDFIKGNVINAIVILTSLGYILYGLVKIQRTELTIEAVITKAGIGILIGLLIKQCLGENGFSKAYRSHIWKDNLERYSHACNLANPYIERIDNFNFCEEIEKREIYRRRNLMSARMHYDTFFDKDGNYKNPKIIKKISSDNNAIVLTPYQRKILNKCIKVKIYNLNLFSEYDNAIENCTKREKTDKTQRAKMFGKNSFGALFTAIAGTYFVAVFNGWNWGEIIIATIQVCIWISMGIIQLYTNYNYVIMEKTNKLTEKIRLIVKFTKGCEAGLYLENPYIDKNNNVNIDKNNNINNDKNNNASIT